MDLHFFNCMNETFHFAVFLPKRIDRTERHCELVLRRSCDMVSFWKGVKGKGEAENVHGIKASSVSFTYFGTYSCFHWSLWAVSHWHRWKHMRGFSLLTLQNFKNYFCAYEHNIWFFSASSRDYFNIWRFSSVPFENTYLWLCTYLIETAVLMPAWLGINITEIGWTYFQTSMHRIGCCGWKRAKWKNMKELCLLQTMECRNVSDQVSSQCWIGSYASHLLIHSWSTWNGMAILSNRRKYQMSDSVRIIIFPKGILQVDLLILFQGTWNESFHTTSCWCSLYFLGKCLGSHSNMNKDLSTWGNLS